MIAAHADWSVRAGKRWITIARGNRGSWRIAAPAPVHDPTSLPERLPVEAAGEPAVLGLDLPIGLPRAYAGKHAETIAANFPEFLRRLADRPDFFLVADSIEQVGPDRPFYPARWRPGHSSGLQGLTARLGIPTTAELLRQCDRGTLGRPPAAPLFWTIGAKQVGKAALNARQFLLLPGLEQARLRLWPFEGELNSLLSPRMVVVCETYPAEALCQLGLKLRGSKRNQTVRAALADPFRNAMRAAGASPEPDLASAIACGFGADAAGEDRMDSFIGLLGMLNVLADIHPNIVPADPWIARWEGWILGQLPAG